jgi:hypothetical protein
VSLSSRSAFARPVVPMLVIGLASVSSTVAFAQVQAEDAGATGGTIVDTGPRESTPALPIADWSSEGIENDWADVSVIITVEDPFSPYAQSTYEWKVRGQSPMVVLTRVHVAGWGRASELGLVAVHEYQPMLTEIGACVTAMQSSSNAPMTNVTSVTMTLRQGGQSFEGTYGVPRVTDTCLDSLLRLVEARMDLSPYRMPFWNEDEWGALQAGSDLPARVYVDGWDTGEVTPLSGLRLVPGVHRVVWRSLQGDLDKDIDVTIERGRTTTVNVILE